MTTSAGVGGGPGRSPMPGGRLVRYGASAALIAAALRTLRRRQQPDPVHAEGHRHRSLPADEPAPSAPSSPGAAHDQPWVRRSHSDSQRRRFRR